MQTTLRNYNMRTGKISAMPWKVVSVHEKDKIMIVRTVRAGKKKENCTDGQDPVKHKDKQ